MTKARPAFRLALALSVGALTAPAVGQSRFVDGTDVAGIDHVYRGNNYGAGCSIVDLDGDGDQDVYLPSGPGRRDRIYANHGDGTFDELGEATGMTHEQISFAANFADLDGDGTLDGFVTTDGPEYLYRGLGGGFYESTPAPTSDGLPAREYGRAAALGDVDGDGLLDVYMVTRGANVLYHNEGDLVFSDWSDVAGAAGKQKGLAAVMADFDDDGDLDLYVVNEFDNDALYVNRGDGSFVFANAAAGLPIEIWAGGDGMGAAVGDYDNDGDQDLFVANYDENFLYRNDGGTFVDVAPELGVEGEVRAKAVGWGTGFLDMDLDGDLEIYVANGGGPFHGGQANYLYDNRGSEGFVDIAVQSEVAGDGNSRGACFGDVDDDGDTDMLVVNTGTNTFDTSRLYYNQAAGQPGNHWLQLELRLADGAVATAGATVRVAYGGRMLSAQLTNGSSYASQNSPRLDLGLGEEPTADVQVRWPDGSHEMFPALAADARHTLRQGTGSPSP